METRTGPIFTACDVGRWFGKTDHVGRLASMAMIVFDVQDRAPDYGLIDRLRQSVHCDLEAIMELLGLLQEVTEDGLVWEWEDHKLVLAPVGD